MKHLIRTFFVLAVVSVLPGCYTALVVQEDPNEQTNYQSSEPWPDQSPRDPILIIAPVYLPPPPVVHPHPPDPGGQIGIIANPPAPHRTETGSKRTDDRHGSSTAEPPRRTSGNGRGGR